MKFLSFILLLLLNVYESKLNPLPGGSLDVFLRYEEITKSLSSNDLFKLWNDCINRVCNDYRAMPCSNEVKEKVKTYSNQFPISLHDNRIRINHPTISNKLLPDCKYAVSFINENDVMSLSLNDNFISFNI